MRNHILDISKIIGIIIVCLLHTAWFPTLYHGYLPVEFFFIVSGYFIYKAAEKEYGIVAFFNKKLKRIYLPYCLALLVFIVLAWFKPNLFTEFDFLPTVLFCSVLLQSHGIPDLFGVEKVIGLCEPAWYLTVLLYGGALLFILLKYTNRRFCLILMTIITICVYTHMLITGAVEHFYNLGIINLPFFRGLAGMFLGCLIAMPQYKNYIGEHITNVRFRSVLNAISIVAIIAAAIIFFTPNTVPVLAVPLFFIILTGMMLPGLWFNNLNALPIFSKISLPDISLEMLILHKATIYPTVVLFEKLPFLDYLILKVITYIGFTFVVSLILKRLVKLILGSHKLLISRASLN